MQNIRQKFTDIKAKLEKRVYDTYLLKYIETPIIDEDKLLILISMMDALDLPYSKLENYCLAAMLIQIALDTHEHINQFSTDGPERQLTVLAGDYYSGLYYKLLAETEDVLVIKALSAGVKEINEHKIMVYRQSQETIETLMASAKLIESSILIKMAKHLQIDYWNEFLTNLLFFKRLLKEKKQLIRGNSSILFDALKKVTVPGNELRKAGFLSDHNNHQLLMVCDRYLEISKQVLEKESFKASYLNEFIKARVSLMLQQHQPFAKTFVEEG